MLFADVGFLFNFLLRFSLSLNDLWEVSMSVRNIVLFGQVLQMTELFLLAFFFNFLFLFLIYLKISVLIHTPYEIFVKN